ncbi:sensor histidine kinase [Lederbergia citrea]|uniref:Histidine kinase n=1 Tax=Lederbergia citrea TaxID=2833581 RepID=A0A942UVP0_9BACI|nr:histidine kinase [Lederbergia citrea]MBS4177778.1 histidine kinase [Lederbergia citrea]MBS4204451.1 histidine kinase [Lederbergia citrea]MBS4223704.1 histidine kinase [Lederbergia citrea]
MVSYESFFLLILISVLGPVVGLLTLIFFNAFERQVYLLEVENTQVLLEKELETSKYIQLNQQIQPHFLFNALNSMLGLIRLKKYDRLENVFEHMVLYLRSKYNEEKSLYTLREELDYTKHFIAIQQLRFGERLQVDWLIEEEIEEALIVPYVLQTLVENAFKHGIENIEGEGILQITIQSTDEQQLLLIVEDNGPGFQVNPLSGKGGVGLMNITKRLKLLFGDEAKIDFLTSQREHGGKVVVSLPKIYHFDELGGEHEDEYSSIGR